LDCYLCGKSKLKIIREKLRYDIKRNVLQCQNCGIVYLEPKAENLENFYKEDYRKLYTPVIGKILESKQIFNIYLPFQQSKVDLIKDKLNLQMKALDIGCSTGHFLYTLRPYVKEVIGIEFNKENAEFVNKVLGIKVYTESVENTNIPLEHFDLITAFQVLEHIDEPLEFLRTISKYLKPDGSLFLEVPNIDDALMSLYGIESYGDFWFREPHIFNYSPKTLSLLLEKAGFGGEISTLQTYNLLNHINWILTGKPQGSVDIGTSVPSLITAGSVDAEIKSDLNSFIRKCDQEYRTILRKYNRGNSVVFIGRKTGVNQT